MYSYDDIKIELAKSLNTKILNNAFTKVLANDFDLVPEYDYTPHIWENTWFNDEVLPGYGRGYCVWKNVYTDVSGFLDVYEQKVWWYSQENDLLKNYITKTWSEIKKMESKPARQLWTEKYCNAISGYAVTVDTGIQITDRLRYLKFEIFGKRGDKFKINRIEFSKTKDGSDYLPYPQLTKAATCHTGVISPEGKITYMFDKDSSTSFSGKLASSDEPAELVIDFGSGFIDLVKYKYWQMYCASDELHRFNLYGSVDGENWAYLDRVQAGEYKDKWYRARATIINREVLKQKLPPMFEYGPFNGEPGMRVELYVSTADNNKALLSDRQAWNYVVLSSQSQYDAFISSQIAELFDEHIEKYHLNGMLLTSEIDNILMRKDFSNFKLDNVANKINMRYHDQDMMAEGFDCVVDFKTRRTSVNVNVGNKMATFNVYQWYRLWNSGWLEHGGTVPCGAAPVHPDPKDYFISVDLTWDGTNKIIYDYPEISGEYYGSTYTRLYYGNTGGDPDQPVIEQFHDVGAGYLGERRYAVHISPVQFDYARDIQDGMYSGIDTLSQYDYPEQCLSTRNRSYVTTEVHHMKNGSFAFTKSNTDNLATSTIRFYTYYVTGYRISK